LTALSAIEDRSIGALLGLATGDAVGTTLEFCPRDTCPPLTDMVGGGPFNLKAGEWTDDTAMALALADSLADRDDLDEQDLLGRFANWWQWGVYSCTGQCFDIGITTRQALARWLSTKEAHCGSIDPMSAGNGSLMRLAPAAIRFWNDRPRLRDVAGRQSKTTHAAPEAVDACLAFAEVLADAIEGRSKPEVLRDRAEPYRGAIGAIMRGQWREKERTAIGSSGYVAHSLEAALWCVDRTTDFRGAVLMAANLGDDADTTAAITGQLAGALYGASGIPESWVNRIAWLDEIREKAVDLMRAADSR
jgi:ADP-ribosyl-[dinitrogen reductase] hydrolase